MLQRGPFGLYHEALADQARQLRGDIVGHIPGRLAVFRLALRVGPFLQHRGDGARHLLRDQVQARAPLFEAQLERRRIGGQRLGEERTVERDGDDLVTQFLQRHQRHALRRHALQVGDVLLEVLERISQLQREQPAQARTVARRSQIGLVEDLDLDMRRPVGERRKPDQRLATLPDLHQLGQLAESPGGVPTGHRHLPLTLALSRERERGQLTPSPSGRGPG